MFDNFCRKTLRNSETKGSVVLLCFLLFSGCHSQEARISDAETHKFDGKTLLEARASFVTKLRESPHYESERTVAIPPEGLMEMVHYPSPLGDMVAYLSPDPGDGKRHPAIIFVKGGFGGIGSWLFEAAPEENDQSVLQFLDEGIITMTPSFRGENGNPGQFELFYGEVEDLLHALEYLRGIAYVDPERIYLAGHSTGGTLALLAATSTNGFRAIFSFGGAPDLLRVVGDGEGYGNTPFNFKSRDESLLRSPIAFVGAITTPTFYFEGEQSIYVKDAERMGSIALMKKVPFEARILLGANHFNILAPLKREIAEKILLDTGERCNIGF